MNTPCRIHYATKNTAPEPKWRELKGHAIAQGRRGGPKNILVDTDEGTVVVPRGNVRFERRGDIMEKCCGNCGRWTQEDQTKRPAAIKNITIGICSLSGKEQKSSDMQGCFGWDRLEPKELERRVKAGLIATDKTSVNVFLPE